MRIYDRPKGSCQVADLMAVDKLFVQIRDPDLFQISRFVSVTVGANCPPQERGIGMDVVFYQPLSLRVEYGSQIGSYMDSGGHRKDSFSLMDRNLVDNKYNDYHWFLNFGDAWAFVLNVAKDFKWLGTKHPHWIYTQSKARKVITIIEKGVI